jgi:hypothetical protein
MDAMIDTVSNSDPKTSIRALIFPVQTRFVTLASRPGGIPRDVALRNARKRILRFLAMPLSRSSRLGRLSTIAGVGLH